MLMVKQISPRQVKHATRVTRKTPQWEMFTQQCTIISALNQCDPIIRSTFTFFLYNLLSVIHLLEIYNLQKLGRKCNTKRDSPCPEKKLYGVSKYMKVKTVKCSIVHKGAVPIFPDPVQVTILRVIFSVQKYIFGEVHYL